MTASSRDSQGRRDIAQQTYELLLVFFFPNDFYYSGKFSAVQKTVNTSSWTQSLKNIPSAGLVKTVRYGFAKINKMWKSLKKNQQTD